MTTAARWNNAIALVLFAFVLAGLPSGARAKITFQVGFSDPGSVYSAYYDRIRRNVVSAGDEWATYFGSGLNATLQVQLSFADIATASASSFTNSYVGLSSGLSTYEQGAAYEIRTGLDPNGSAPDIRMAIGRNGYLQNELWFDPSPQLQNTTVPLNRTDARSVFLHEFAHAFAFNGWRDGTTGTLPGGYQSTFDAWVTKGSYLGQPQLYFNGGSARALYGGPVPLTFANYGHLGNAGPRPGSQLIGDLMGGVSFYRGSRYHVTPLDLAILRDTGLTAFGSGAAMASAEPPNFAAVAFSTAVPEPGTYALMGLGLVAVVWASRRKDHAGHKDRIRPRGD